MTSEANLTALLGQWRDGDSEAQARLMELVYPELRRIAKAHFRKERSGHTLQPTALVNEVFLRLERTRQVEWQDRAHFFAFASRLMRHVLIDHARKAMAAKRDGIEISLEDLSWVPVSHSPEQLIALDLAMSRLRDADPQAVRIVEFHFFGGLSHEAIAEIEGLTARTVRRRWAGARRRLARELGRPVAPP